MWPLLPTIVLSMALICEQEPCIWNKGHSELSWETVLHSSLLISSYLRSRGIDGLLLNYLVKGDVTRKCLPREQWLGRFVLNGSMQPIIKY